MNFSGRIKDDLNTIKKRLFSDDVIYFEFKIGEIHSAVVYVDSITDKETLAQNVIKPLTSFHGKPSAKELASSVELAHTKTGNTLDDFISDVLNGNPSFLVDGLKEYFSVDLKKFDVRAVTEPPLQTVIKGPREGFNESIKTNLSLLRRRI